MTDFDRDIAKLSASYFAKPVAILAVLVVGGVLLSRSCAPSSTPLPAKAQVQFDNDRIARAVDTAEVNRNARDEAAAKAREHAASLARQRLEESAAKEHARADSLARIAAQVVSSADSSSWAWQAAYTARTSENAILRQSLDSAKAETHHADIATVHADTVGSINLRHADRADSLVTTLVDVATHPDQCKVAWVLNCPTRTQAVVGGVVVGAATYAIVEAAVKGKLKIPLLSIRF